MPNYKEESMFYKNCIQSIILTLSIIMGILVCVFGTVMADEHPEASEETEATR